ncbi:MAG: heavy metal translocating P-type ATPase [Rhodospirillaceae bacterium]
MTALSVNVSGAAEAAEIIEPSAYVTCEDDGTASMHLLVNDVHCANCIRRIEGALQGEPGVVAARVNLSTRRMTVRWRVGEVRPGVLIERLEALGFHPVPYDPAALGGLRKMEEAFLLRCLAVAGFASGNIMLLSVSVWAGAFSDMEEITRSLMHWVSALIALPAIAYAGRPFFRSALAALGGRRMNMDVPISLAVVVTAGVSLFEVIVGGPHAYFDASVMLLFFLLVGRYLDVRTRGGMRSTAENLAALAMQPATVVEPDGTRRFVPANSVLRGATVIVAAGERIPVDGTVASGTTVIDVSLLTGESAPVQAGPHDDVLAGTLNIGEPITIRAAATGDRTVLADIVHLVESAEQGRAAYVRLADRAARLYSPVVHVLALATLLGWHVVGGLGLHESILIAVAVLIITCPCALGLAVPAVQVTAAGRLLRSGVLVKSGDALERLAAVDTVVLDKTGTLTLGRPEIVNRAELTEEDIAAAASLAVASRHPLCRAVAGAAGPVPVADGVREAPGMGLAAASPEGEIRLGNRDWCGVSGDAGESAPGSELWLGRPGRVPVRFRFADRPRPDAAAFVCWLHDQGLPVELLSGDRAPAVRALAEELGIADWSAGMRPEAKLARLDELKAAGRKVLMIGDGLNDAPSLAAAFASVSPATGADVSQTAADIVFQSDRLEPVAEALVVARQSRRLVLENFALAGGYNALAIPLAVAGFVTPLIAAAAMSASSVLVTLNALRLGRSRGPITGRAQE